MKIRLFILFYVLNNLCVLGQTTNILVGDFYYYFSGDEAWISNKGTESYASWYTGWYTQTTCYIPDYVEYNGANYKVTKIDKRAFEYCTSISKVSIPNTVTTINRSAFEGCTGLQEIIIPSSVTTFPAPVVDFSYYAPFYGCNFLRTIIYTRKTAPANWTATTRTYVPDIVSYSNPSYSMNQANILEMITFGTNTFVYTGQSPRTTWTNNVEGYTASLTMPTLEKNAGSYVAYIPVTFTKGSESFSTEVAYRYTIKGVELTAKVEDASRVYGDNNPAFNITYSGFINGDNESVITTKPTVTTTATASSNVGSYPISISGGAAQNYTFKYETGTLTITKAALEISVNDATKVYGSANPAFTLNYSGLKNNETNPDWEKSPTFSTTADKTSDVGDYQITVDCSATNYYITKNNPGTLTITPAVLTVKANNASRLYFDADPEYTYAVTGFLNGDTDASFTQSPIFKTNATVTSEVGTYTITPYGAESRNYDIKYETGVLTINKRELTAFAENKTKYYGDSNPIFTVKYEGFVNGQNESDLISQPTASCIANTSSNIGNYDITLDGGSATNYTIKLVKGVLTIIKAPLTVFVNDCTKTYGQANPAFTCSYEGLKNNETTPQWITTPSYSTEATTTSDVGTYDITVNCVAKNYEVTCIEGKLTITKAQLIIKANNETRLYYDNNPEFSFTCYGLQNSDNVSILTKDPTIECEASILSKVGSYPIHISNADCRNYNISYEDGVLIINKRELDVYPKDATRKYAENNPVFDCVINGFVNNEDINVLIQKPIVYTNATTFSDVGTYEIFAKEADADNYSFNYHQGTLTITKADQVITWEQSFEDIVIGDQIELLAVSSSGLDIEYIFDTDIVSLYMVGDKQFLDCLASGTFAIRATQNGNNNYNAAVRVAKTIEIIDPSSIVDIHTDTSNKPLYFDIFGRHLSNPKKGFIIRNQNDVTNKIIIK